MHVLQWECPVLRQLWKRSCAACLVICCRRELSPKSQTISTVVATHPRSCLKTGRRSCRLFTSVTSACQLPRQSSTPSRPWLDLERRYSHCQPTPCQHPGLLSRTRYCRAYEILCRCIQGPLSCDSTVFSISRPPSMKQQPGVNPKNLSLGLHVLTGTRTIT